MKFKDYSDLCQEALIEFIFSVAGELERDSYEGDYEALSFNSGVSDMAHELVNRIKKEV